MYERERESECTTLWEAGDDTGISLLAVYPSLSLVFFTGSCKDFLLELSQMLALIIPIFTYLQGKASSVSC